MAWRILRSIYSLSFPGGFVVLGLWLLVDRWGSPSALEQLGQIWPWAVFAVVLALGFWFHQFRILLTALACALAERGLDHLADMGLSPAREQPLESAIILLLALDLVWIGSVRSRARLSWRSAGLVVVILMQGLLMAVLLSSAGAGVQELLLAKGEILVRRPIALGALLGAATLAGVRALLRGGADRRGLLWAAIATALAVSSGGSVPFSVYFSGSALILVLAILEASYQMAYEDELTALPSRRAMNEALIDLGEAYSIALVDIDHFKQVNDRHGHEVGDQVLQAVASHLRRVGGGGRPFRYGGEEFALLFPGQRVAEVLPHLEALRSEIEAARFSLRGRGRPKRASKRATARRGRRRRRGRALAVTVSIGVAHPTPGRPGAEAVLKAADQALYRAKRGGRNQVRK